MLILTGSFETLLSYTILAAWIFYSLSAAAVWVLRRRAPDAPRPHRMWGYPVTPVLFLAVTLYFVGNTLITRPGPSLAGLGLIATGVPVYFLWRRANRIRK